MRGGCFDPNEAVSEILEIVGEAGVAGTPGPKGDTGAVGPAGVAGAPGRSVAVFEQPTEPGAAVAGDLWIIP